MIMKPQDLEQSRLATDRLIAQMYQDAGSFDRIKDAPGVDAIDIDAAQRTADLARQVAQRDYQLSLIAAAAADSEEERIAALKQLDASNFAYGSSLKASTEINNAQRQLTSSTTSAAKGDLPGAQAGAEKAAEHLKLAQPHFEAVSDYVPRSPFMAAILKGAVSAIKGLDDGLNFVERSGSNLASMFAKGLRSVGAGAAAFGQTLVGAVAKMGDAIKEGGRKAVQAALDLRDYAAGLPARAYRATVEGAKEGVATVGAYAAYGAWKTIQAGAAVADKAQEMVADVSRNVEAVRVRGQEAFADFKERSAANRKAVVDGAKAVVETVAVHTKAAASAVTEVVSEVGSEIGGKYQQKLVELKQGNQEEEQKFERPRGG